MRTRAVASVLEHKGGVVLRSAQADENAESEWVASGALLHGHALVSALGNCGRSPPTLAALVRLIDFGNGASSASGRRDRGCRTVNHCAAAAAVASSPTMRSSGAATIRSCGSVSERNLGASSDREC